MAGPFIACSSGNNGLAIEHGKKTDSPRKRRGRGSRATGGAGRALSRIRAVHDHESRASRCARWTQAGAPPHPVRHAAVAARSWAAFKKSAKVVGDVMGNFHPHGDQAIYDALVRLAQEFAQRYPLVDGQGNFGNIDGDSAAAMRYTEARLTEVARLLIDGIDEDAVDFRATYDGTSEEPVVLPAAFPNLLANGSQGIAVGMATAIPPHN